MIGSVRFFVESYTLCVPELKSVGWQCAILGQLVGTRNIPDGCRDPGKLQNVFIFTVLYVMNIIVVCTCMVWYMKNSMEPFIIVSDNFNVTTINKIIMFHKCNILKQHDIFQYIYITIPCKH